MNRGLNGHDCGHLAVPADACSVDRASRQQIAAAARLLRSIRPSDGEVEIRLHEIARALEQIAEAGWAGGAGRPAASAASAAPSAGAA